MSKKSLSLFLSVAMMSTVAVKADVFISESFPYSAGNLNSQGTWVVSGSAGSNPINVQDGSLTYPGYQDEASGNCVVLDMQMGKNACQNIFAPVGTDAVAGPLYYSALVCVDEFPASLGKPGAIMALTGVNAYDGSYGDSLTGSEGGGLFVKKGNGDNTAVFGISRKSSPNGITATDVTWCDKEVAVGEVALVVVCYEKVDGDDNDLMSLWVNPATDAAEPDVTGGGEESLVDVRGIELCQRSAITSKNPQVTVDELRVATEWDEIFTGSATPIVVPNVTFSENPINFGQVYCNISVERTLRVSATDLEGDITLTLGESGQVALSVMSISKEDAMSEDGFELTVTLSPVESRFFSDRITVSTPGMSDKVLLIEWRPVPSFVATTFSQLCNEDVNDMTSVYIYRGDATVTFVESYYDLSYDRIVNSIFAQDATGGVELRSATGCGYEEVDITDIKAGDKITEIVGYLIFGDNGLTMVPRTSRSWEVVPGDNHVEPIEVTLKQLAMAENGYIYGNQLVRVKDVVFPDEYFEAGDYYGLWNSQKYEIYDGTLDDHQGLAWMWCNKGADYYKQPTTGYFDHRWTLTGICNSYYPIHISPRSKADFSDQGLKYSGVEDVTGEMVTEVAVYDLQGRPADATGGSGMYIVRMSDGSVRKVVR